MKENKNKTQNCVINYWNYDYYKKQQEFFG